MPQNPNVPNFINPEDTGGVVVDPRRVALVDATREINTRELPEGWRFGAGGQVWVGTYWKDIYPKDLDKGPIADLVIHGIGVNTRVVLNEPSPTGINIYSAASLIHSPFYRRTFDDLVIPYDGEMLTIPEFTEKFPGNGVGQILRAFPWGEPVTTVDAIAFLPIDASGQVPTEFEIETNHVGGEYALLALGEGGEYLGGYITRAPITGHGPKGNVCFRADAVVQMTLTEILKRDIREDAGSITILAVPLINSYARDDGGGNDERKNPILPASKPGTVINYDLLGLKGKKKFDLFPPTDTGQEAGNFFLGEKGGNLRAWQSEASSGTGPTSHTGPVRLSKVDITNSKRQGTQTGYRSRVDIDPKSPSLAIRLGHMGVLIGDDGKAKLPPSLRLPGPGQE